MIEALRFPTFRSLFAAQVIALIGTGLATVALSLLAYDLAGAEAGAVLGTALAIKMIVYVLLAPCLERLSRQICANRSLLHSTWCGQVQRFACRSSTRSGRCTC